MNKLKITRRQTLLGATGFFSGLAGLNRSPASAALIPVNAVSGIVSSYDGYLNLRTGPGIGYPIVTRVSNGRTVSITGTSGDWFRAAVAGRSGWLSSWYVHLTGATSTAIHRGNSARKRVALTFDCGSDYGYTDAILATLAKQGIPASFSFTGDWIEKFPDGARRTVDSGHQIINHTLTHPSFTGLSTPGTGPRSPAKRLSQLLANESLIKKVTGATTKPYWRPPYGDIDNSVLSDVGAAGFTQTAMWTIDSLGWNALGADAIYKRIMDNMVWGAIVLMHVGIQSQDAAALDRIIRSLKSSGYGFATVADIAL